MKKCMMVAMVAGLVLIIVGSSVQAGIRQNDGINVNTGLVAKYIGDSQIRTFIGNSQTGNVGSLNGTQSTDLGLVGSVSAGRIGVARLNVDACKNQNQVVAPRYIGQNQVGNFSGSTTAWQSGESMTEFSNVMKQDASTSRMNGANISDTWAMMKSNAGPSEKAVATGTLNASTSSNQTVTGFPRYGAGIN